MNWLTLLAPLLKFLEPKSSPEEEDLWATVSLKLEMNKMLKRLFKPWTRKTSMADKSTLRLPDQEKKVKVNNNSNNNHKKTRVASPEEEEVEEEEEAVSVVLPTLEVASEEGLTTKVNKVNKENNKIDQEEEVDSVVPEEVPEEEPEEVPEVERPVELQLDLTPEPSQRLPSLLLTCHFLLMMLLLERSSLMLVLNSRLLML